jgi:hypothetical protein
MEWVSFLLDKLEKEWKVINEIPITLGIIFFLSIVIGYFLSRWRHQGIINILKYKIDIELPSKDKEINQLENIISEYIKEDEKKENLESLNQLVDAMKKVKKP